MWINFTFILILCLITFIGFSGYSLAKNNADKVPNRAGLANQLAQLPPNYDGPPEGAMCYDMAAPVNRVQYHCPVCEESTSYYSTFGDNIGDLYNIRLSISRITKIDVKLDESQFCKKCSPDVKNPEYCIIVTYGKNAQPHKTCGIDLVDLSLLYDFSEGKKEHNNSPISKYKERLEELLGTKLNDAGK